VADGKIHLGRGSGKLRRQGVGGAEADAQAAVPFADGHGQEGQSHLLQVKDEFTGAGRGQTDAAAGDVHALGGEAEHGIRVSAQAFDGPAHSGAALLRGGEAGDHGGHGQEGIGEGEAVEHEAHKRTQHEGEGVALEEPLVGHDPGDFNGEDGRDADGDPGGAEAGAGVVVGGQEQRSVGGQILQAGVADGRGDLFVEL
jgi:hypothetical protein